jgi:Peptidogalycan biosysnthesis/recognition
VTGPWHAEFTGADGPPPAWDALDPSPPLFASRRWLSVMGHRMEGEHNYFISGTGQRGEAGFFGSVIDDPRITVSKNPWQLLFEPCDGLRSLPEQAAASQAAAAAAAGDPAGWFPALVLAYPGLECFPIGPQAGTPAAVEHAIAGVVAAARSAGVRTVAFLYVQPECEVLAATLRKAGLIEFPITQRANLRLPGGSFADYLGTLSRHRRKRVRADRRKLSENGIAVESLPLTEADDGIIETLVALRQQHRGKYGKRPDDESERRLLRAFRAFAGGVTVYRAITDRHQSVGFSLFLDSGEISHCWTCGFDYTDPRSRLTYFELCYYAPIEAAYQGQVREFSFSYGAEMTKMLRGCQLDTVHGYLLAIDDEARTATARAAAAALADT